MAAMQKAVVTIDRSKTIRSVNREAVRMFGYQRAEELIGNSVTILVPPPWKEQHDSFIDNYHRTGIAKVIGRAREVQGQKKDGSVFKIRLSLTQLTVKDEVYYCGLIEKLEDKSAFVTSDETGVIISVNHATERMFGYAEAELLGKNVGILAASPHSENHELYMQRYRQSGVKRVLGKVRNLKAKHKDGSEMPITIEINEVIEGTQKIFTARLTQITEQMEAHVTIDSKGCIRSLNDTMWVMFGFSREELMGKNIKVLMAHPHAEMHDTYIKRYLRTKKKRIIGTTRVLKAKHKDGSLFYINLEVNEFMQDGEIMFGGKITRVLSQTEKRHAPEVRYIGNYQIERVLAEGLYGQVRLATHHLTKEKVVIKTIEKSKIDPARFREIAVMKELKHPHVVRLLEVVEAPQKLYIVLQYIDGGELYEYAVAKDKLSEDEARIFWRQLVQGVYYMHSRGVVHRDLKLENIMLDKDRNVIIIDLGLSNFSHTDKLLDTFCGSSSYAAPEMFLCRKYHGPEVDIWSMGVIVYCMVLGYLPFEDPQHIVDADYIPFEEQDKVSPEFQDMIAGIFQFDPLKRMTIEDLRTHPWTNKGLPIVEKPQTAKAIDSIEEDRELLQKLEDFGFDKDSILKCVTQDDFNQITASMFLLQQQKKHGEGGGGGCPFAGLHQRQQPQEEKEEDEEPKEKQSGCPFAQALKEAEEEEEKEKEKETKGKEEKEEEKKKEKDEKKKKEREEEQEVEKELSKEEGKEKEIPSKGKKKKKTIKSLLGLGSKHSEKKEKKKKDSKEGLAKPKKEKAHKEKKTKENDNKTKKDSSSSSSKD